jgi:outer membrane protein TolC
MLLSSSFIIALLIQGAPERLSFDEAVEEALVHNPSVAIAKDEIARAAALMVETRAQSIPTIFGSASYIRLDADRGSLGAISTYAGELGASVVLTVPLVSPAQWAAWAHAEDDIAVARESEADVHRRIATLVAHTYLSIVARHRLLEVEARARDTAKSHVDYTHARAASGVGPELDEVRAMQELEAAEAELDSSLAQLERQKEALGVLIGLNHAVDVELTVDLEPPPALDDALAQATRDRADVRLSRERLDAAQHRTRDNYTDWLPALVGTFQPFLQDPGTPQFPSTGWQGGIALSLPIFDGGFRFGKADERAALESEAEIDLGQSERQARSDVRSAYQAVDRLEHALESAQSSAAQAGKALDMALLAYRTGTTGNLEVIDAERRARDAESASAIAEDAVRQAELDLLAASGRFPRSSLARNG